MNWDYSSVSAAIQALSGRYENAAVTVLTRSVLGCDIPMIALGKGNKAVLYVGTHRGTDSITGGILLDFAADILQKHEKDATVFDYPMRYLFEKRKIYIVPMLNPDGAEYVIHGIEAKNPLYERVMKMAESRDMTRWQANARGVDLHHNYDAGFSAFKKQAGKQNGASSVYSGEFPESEPETAALARFLRLRREEIAGVLSLHTAGEELICNCSDNLSAKTMAVGRVLSRMTGYRLTRPEQVRACGSLSDWCIEVLGRPAFTVMCGEGEAPLSDEQRALIYERLRRSLFSFPFLV